MPRLVVTACRNNHSLAFIWLLGVSLLSSAVLACVQTGSSGSGVSTTNQCAATSPANSVGLVEYAAESETPYDGLPLGYCSCPAPNAIRYVFPANTNNNPNTRRKGEPFGPNINCADITQLCLCDEQCNCYKAYGQLGARGTGGLNVQLAFVPYCDAGGCHMYTTIICTTTLSDPNSGLQNIVTGEQIPCSSQFNANGNYQLIGTNSPYIKAFSVSCHGCVNCPTCGGTFTTLPQHTG